MINEHCISSFSYWHWYVCVCVTVCACMCVHACVCVCASHTHTHHIQQYITHTLKSDKHTIFIYRHSFVHQLLEKGFTMTICTFCVVLLKSAFFNSFYLLTFWMFGSQVWAVSNIESPPTEDKTHLHKDKCVQKKHQTNSIKIYL